MKKETSDFKRAGRGSWESMEGEKRRENDEILS